MEFNRKLMMAASAAVLLASLGAAPVLAAETPAAQDPNTVAEVVVVGASSAQGQKKQDAPYAITTVGEQAILDAAPTSAADLVKLVPGLFAETTGGVSGPNIEVRGFPTAGDAPFVTMMLDGLPVFPVSTLSFLDNSTQFRLDDTVKRVEATIGGPSVLWGNAQPGATINYTQKTGKTDQNGLVRVTVGSGNLYRFDGYYGAQLAEGWYGSVGGFYRTDTGVRDTQFPADKGYQLAGTLTHDIEGGSLTVYARTTHDQNAFFTPIPLISNGGNSISGFPGFNPRTGTFIGNANRVVTYDVAPNGGLLTADLGNGRGVDNHIFGFDFTKSVNGYDFSNKMSYLSGDALTVAQFTGANPQTLQSFINSEVSAANANAAVLAAAGGAPATTGAATFVGGGAPVTNLNQQVIVIGVWYVDKRLTAFQDEARISHKLSDNNTLTVGAYYTNYTSHDLWHLGNNQLMTVQNNALPIAVKLNNGVLATNADGVYAPSFYSVNNSYTGTNVAGIIADDWRISDRLKIDGGVRFEQETIDATEEGITSGFIGTNPLSLYDYGASYLNGTTTGAHYSHNAVAYALDADYKIDTNFNAFVGFNHGYVMPTFDDIRGGVTEITKVDQLQAGVKKIGSVYSVYLTAFYNKFTGQPSQQILANGQIINYLTSSETEGVEFEGAVRPIEGLQLTLSGDYQHGQYTAGGPGITNNTVVRQPEFQFRFTPSYNLPTAYGDLKLYATGTYVGKRYADLQNTQVLPDYATLDLGVLYALKNGVDIQLTGTNVTNTLAITEGNVRVLGSGVTTGGVFLGRPLFGATYMLSASLHF